MHKLDHLQAIEKPLDSLPHNLRNNIIERLRNLTHYEPVIGIMGKTGVVKPSLYNVLFHSKVTHVTTVSASPSALR
ncbi:TPA: hypothetical protein NV473_003326 [Citrobacter freundii]|nr:ngrB [Citrobacter freundii]EKX2185735.1 hypothetical protein [Citrobacter freundii]MBJ8969888.1 hypothetical protein [Citrobacter freundii]HCA7357859.1 hypothetical protein [Citrobacter freundii]HCJ7745202.1 hypothetical protein [Citrobacter freundii]